MRHASILSILFPDIPYLPINTWAACPDGHMLYTKGAMHILDRAKIPAFAPGSGGDGFGLSIAP